MSKQKKELDNISSMVINMSKPQREKLVGDELLVPPYVEALSLPKSFHFMHILPVFVKSFYINSLIDDIGDAQTAIASQSTFFPAFASEKAPTRTQIGHFER